MTCLNCLTWQLKYPYSGSQDLPPIAKVQSSSAACFVHYASNHWTYHCRSSEKESQYVVGALQEYLQCSLKIQLISEQEDSRVRNRLELPDMRNPILRECSRHGFTELGSIYVEMGAAVDSVDDRSCTSPLALALNNQQWKMANFLIDRGASLAHVVGAEKTSMLHQASACGRNDIVAFLLRYGPSIAKCCSSLVLWKE